jgi:hypothetical protein
MSDKYKLPELVGTLAMLPDETKKTIEKYGMACASIASRRPAPCEHACESRAFEIEIRQLRAENEGIKRERGGLIEQLTATNRRLKEIEAQKPVVVASILPKATGVSIDSESPGCRSVLVHFPRMLESHELGALHEMLASPTLNLAPLRELRHWHWKQYLATKSFVKTNESTKEGIATRHLTAVQALNDLFPIGDTADNDDQLDTLRAHGLEDHLWKEDRDEGGDA